MDTFSPVNTLNAFGVFLALATRYSTAVILKNLKQLPKVHFVSFLIGWLVGSMLPTNQPMKQPKPESHAEPTHRSNGRHTG
jgi:hypothetical protein